MSTTPLMGLIIPDVSVTPGPQYATLEVTAFNTIDAHDHTAGKGTLVPTAGLNVNADLPINGYNLNAVRTVRLATQAATPTGPSDTRIVYAKQNELAYRDGTGTEVILTASGSVAGATGTITGLTSPATAAFNAVSGVFAFQKDASKPGKLAISDINLYEYDNATAAAITIKSPASLASAYNLTLPALLPTQSSIVSITTTGVLSTGLIDGTVSAPGLAFAADLGTGVYRPTTSQIAVTTGGTQVALFATGATTLTGTLAAGATTITGALSASGATATGALTVTGLIAGSTVVQVGDGSSATPAYAFGADHTMGMYREGVNILGLAVGGSQVMQLTGGGITLTGPRLGIVDGTVASPSAQFSNETGTGMYRPGVGQLALAVLGVQRAVVNGSGATITGTFGVSGATTLSSTLGVAGDVTLSSALTVASTITPTAGIASNNAAGNFKTAIFAGGGTLAAGAERTCTVSGTIISATGYATTDTGFYRPMPANGTAPVDTTTISFIPANTASSAIIHNYGAATNTYNVLIVYQ